MHISSNDDGNTIFSFPVTEETPFQFDLLSKSYKVEYVYTYE